MATLTRGERFKDARIVFNQNGKQTLREVELATGVNKAKIQALEDDNNKRSVGYEDIAALARHYGVTSDYLLSLSDDPSRKPSVIDDLKLSVGAINWLRAIADSPDQSRYTSHFSTLLEMTSFKTLVHSLIDYFSALKAASVCSKILKSINEGNSALYPDAKTYMEKLSAAIKDPQYDEMERLHLEAFYGFEKAYLDEGMVCILADAEDSIHVLDILDLKINRNLNALIHEIEKRYE